MATRRTAGRGIVLINADCGNGATTTLRILGSHIAAIGTEPEPGDRIVDLQGDRLLPGLINAHDHLQLNNFPRLKYRSLYQNIREWISDVEMHRRTDSTLRTCEAIPREERLMLGGIKNLLSGVTSVTHHDPLYQTLMADGYPVRVVANYGWSHSLQLDGDEKVRLSHQQTPDHWPWIIHAAEGTDEAAAIEFESLESLGCMGTNTLLVHGIALVERQLQRLLDAGAGLIWCPSSNLHLFGRTADVAHLVAEGRVALGTDSRLSGARDLLEELRIARNVCGLDDKSLEIIVGEAAARLLRLSDRGALRVGTLADLLVLPSKMPLCRATRADVRMVMVGGIMRYGDVEYGQVLPQPAGLADVHVDGAAKVLDQKLVTFLTRSRVREPGVEIAEREWCGA
jgi:cytosine/adenosine deaminase-related metal-dependent hydrolase